jgi:hypothetical protein
LSKSSKSRSRGRRRRRRSRAKPPERKSGLSSLLPALITLLPELVHRVGRLGEPKLAFSKTPQSNQRIDFGGGWAGLAEGPKEFGLGQTWNFMGRKTQIPRRFVDAQASRQMPQTEELMPVWIHTFRPLSIPACWELSPVIPSRRKPRNLLLGSNSKDWLITKMDDLNLKHAKTPIVVLLSNRFIFSSVKWKR